MSQAAAPRVSFVSPGGPETTNVNFPLPKKKWRTTAAELEVIVDPITETLSLPEIEIIRRSLQATVEGSFLPDWEFQTLVGVDRETVRKVYAAWPHQTVGHEDFSCAVVGSLNNLLGYPHNSEDELVTYVPEGRAAIRKALNQLIALGI